MSKLAVRSRQDEQMDAADLDPAVYEQVLHDLARVNRWTFTAHPVLAFMKARDRRREELPPDRCRLRRRRHLARHRPLGAAARHRRPIWSASTSTRRACARRSAATPAGLAIDYRAGDYLDQAGPFDFIISSQVTHHMTDDQLLTFLRHMEAEARMGWLVCDLHRHGFAHWGFPILARLMFVHRIVREDGQLSIARSFRPAEWEELLAEAGIPRRARRGSSAASRSACAWSGCASRRSVSGRGAGPTQSEREIRTERWTAAAVGGAAAVQLSYHLGVVVRTMWAIISSRLSRMSAARRPRRPAR